MELKEHQIKVVEYMKKSNQKGIILYHTLGSGKTITAISISKLYDNDVYCITPASMRIQWTNELQKMHVNMKRYTITSFESLTKIIKKNPNILKSKIVIIDEAHRLRNNGKIAKKIIKNTSTCFKVILLTGTPLVNDIMDICPLINCLTGKYTLPLKEKTFEKKFYNGKTFDETLFKKVVNKLISYYHPEESNDYPDFTTCIVRIKMSQQQQIVYKKALSQIPNKELHDIQTGKRMNFNSFLNATRQVSNTWQSQSETPKLMKILKYINQNEKPALVYSNFLSNGIVPLHNLLLKNNISCLLFTGELNDEEKHNVIKKYNSGAIDVLLLSSSGGEGLDLKNTRQIHIMEPHWNDAKINQVIGRGLRYKSHESLSPNDRHVKIFHWLSILDKNSKELSVDEYLHLMSEEKTKEIDKFKKLLIECSVEK